MKNSLRRIFALALVVMMIASLGMSAFAADDDTTYANNVVTFTKTLTKEANAYAPNTTYTFTINPAATTDGLDSTKSIYAGPADGVAFVDGDDAGTNQSVSGNTLTIKSAPADSDINATTPVTSLTYIGKIQINTSAFTKSGIYRYVVTENDCNYAGVDCDTDARYLDIYIEETVSEGVASYVVKAAVMYKASAGATETKDADGNVTAITYNDKGGFDNDYDTADLTVSKTVSGNLGEKNKNFSFTVTIEGAQGEQYYIVTPAGNQTITTAAQTVGSGDEVKTIYVASATIDLKDGESFTVYGLSVTDKYTVYEKDYSADGYTTTAKVNDVAETLTSKTVNENDKVNTTATHTIDEVTKTVTGEDDQATEEEVNQTVAFTNDKNATIPTGIAMTVLPFVAMLAMAAVVAILFFRKKERREA